VAIDAAVEIFPVGADDSIPVVAHFTNTGNTTARDLLICASRNGSIGDSARLDSITPGETARVRRVLPPAGQPTNVKLNIWARVPTDWCTHNDTAVTSTYVYPRGTRSVEGFEPDRTPTFPPEGWLVYNGGDTNTWYRAGPGDRRAHSGNYYAMCARTDRDDDWLITYGLTPDPGAADTVGLFFSTSGGSSYPQVWALGSQDPNDVLELLLDTMIPPEIWLVKRVGLDQFDGRTVYVGFKSSVYQAGLTRLDDIWFTSSRASAITEPTCASARSPGLGLGQNPITGGQLRILYQLASPQPVRISILDVAGRLLGERRVQCPQTDGQVVVDVRGWPRGVYYVVVRAGTSNASRKCVISGERP
jgi:hypothetical protein